MVENDLPTSQHIPYLGNEHCVLAFPQTQEKNCRLFPNLKQVLSFSQEVYPAFPLLRIALEHSCFRSFPWDRPRKDIFPAHPAVPPCQHSGRHCHGGGGVQRKSCGGRGSLRPSSVRGDVTVNCRSGAMVSHGRARPVPVQAGRSLCTWPSSSAFPSFWGADIFPCCLYFLVLFILLFTYWCENRLGI